MPTWFLRCASAPFSISDFSIRWLPFQGLVLSAYSHQLANQLAVLFAVKGHVLTIRRANDKFIQGIWHPRHLETSSQGQQCDGVLRLNGMLRPESLQLWLQKARPRHRRMGNCRSTGGEDEVTADCGRKVIFVVGAVRLVRRQCQGTTRRILSKTVFPVKATAVIGSD